MTSGCRGMAQFCTTPGCVEWPSRFLSPPMRPIVSESAVVEHPELVASRIMNYASVVGRAQVIAGTDCGFSQGWQMIRVHPDAQWAKLSVLVEGATVASGELWS